MIAVSGVTAITPNPGRSFLGWLASMEETRKVVKPFGSRAEMNKEANVCTMLPTTSLDDSDVTSHDSYNCSSLFYDDGGFDVPQSQISSQHDRKLSYTRFYIAELCVPKSEITKH